MFRTTWRELVKSALDEINVSSSEGSSNSVQDEPARAFRRLKILLDSWNLDNLMQRGLRHVIYDSNKVEWEPAWGSSTNRFVLSSGAVVGSEYPVISLEEDATFPSDFESVSIRSNYRGNEMYGLRESDRNEWNDWDTQYFTNAINAYYYIANYERDIITTAGVTGRNSINDGIMFFDGDFYKGDTLELLFPYNYNVNAIQIEDQIDLPSGWYEALMSCLAVDLAPQYGVSARDISAVTIDNMEKGKALIMARWSSPTKLRFDDTIGISRSGSYRNRVERRR